MANAPSPEEVLEAWRELAGTEAVAALRQYLDGLVAEYTADVTDDRLWDHPSLAAAAAARYDLALRIRVDLEDTLSAVQQRTDRQVTGG